MEVVEGDADRMQADHQAHAPAAAGDFDGIYEYAVEADLDQVFIGAHLAGFDKFKAKWQALGGRTAVRRRPI